MKIAIFLVLLGLAASATVNVKTCSCTSAVNSTDCSVLQSGMCFWTGTACRTATCADITGPSITTCNKYGCVFKGTACAAFTQCSDYTVTDATQCAAYYYSGTTRCVAGAVASGSYPCQNAPVTAAPTCTPGTSTTCLGLSNSAGKCGWNGTACVAYTPSKCGDYTTYGADACATSFLCVWSSSACVDKTCANQAAASCSSYPNSAGTQMTLCAGSPCAEVALTSLVNTNCASSTGGGAIWTSGNVCTSCHALALFATLILAFMF